MTDTTPAALAALTQPIRDALDLALDFARAEAAHVHQSLDGYQQHRHDAADADVALIEAGIAALDALARERDANALDAARYCWIRYKTAGLQDNEGRQCFSFPSMFGLRPVTNIMQGSVSQHLDAAIDAALQGAKP